jgi:hypothetical protein
MLEFDDARVDFSLRKLLSLFAGKPASPSGDMARGVSFLSAAIFSDNGR